jgi:hypothetical protein
MAQDFLFSVFKNTKQTSYTKYGVEATYKNTVFEKSVEQGKKKRMLEGIWATAMSLGGEGEKQGR